MIRTFALASLAGLGLMLAGAAPAEAAAPHHYHVQFRSMEWKERSFFNHALAHEFADMKRAQGFDVRIDHHRSHFHVRFRMSDWQTYRTVRSHSLAHELEDMLQRRGFQARVVHH